MKLDHPRDSEFHITPLGKFADSRLEVDFQTMQFEKWQTPAMVVLGCIALISIAMFVVDIVYGTPAMNATELRIYRMIVMVGATALFAFFLFRRGHPYLRIASELFVVVYLCIVVLHMFRRDYVGFVAPVTQIGIIFSLYLLTPFTWPRQLVYAVSWSIAGMLGWYWKIGIGFEFYSILTWQFFAQGAGAFVARHLHLLTRAMYRDRLISNKQLDIERLLRGQLSTLIELLTHELRNPLASIQTQADLIIRTSAEEKTRLIATRISISSRLAAEVILNWVERAWEAGTKSSEFLDSPTSLRQLVLRVVEELGQRYPDFRVDVSEREAPPTKVDERIVLLAIANVLENAAKYAGSDKSVRVQFRINARTVTVRIRDFGPGIALADQEKIFLKHQHLPDHCDQCEGSGLGLFLVREMLGQCGATIRIQSQLGWGSAFLIELPIV